MSKRKRGRRGLRVALASAIAALGVSAVGVSSASAATVTLDHGFLKIALPDAFEIIDDTTGPVVLSGFDPDGGGRPTATTPSRSLTSISRSSRGRCSAQPLTVDVDPCRSKPDRYLQRGHRSADREREQLGVDDRLRAATRARSRRSRWRSRRTPTRCSRATRSTPRPSTRPLNGAISDDWASLPPGVGAGCGLINQATNAPGGLWLSNGVATALVRAAAAGSPGDAHAAGHEEEEVQEEEEEGQERFGRGQVQEEEEEEVEADFF